MISYNPKDWFTFIFKFHKADTFRQLLLLIIGICAYSTVIAWLELDFWKLSEKSYVRNIPVMHTLLGFALSMLLVFRTNKHMTGGGKAGNSGAAWSITAGILP